jgi:tetratricopeptide (TPR) repeat protein
MKRICLLTGFVLGGLTLVASAFAQSDTAFATANHEYAQGQFKDAIRDYEALVRSGDWSAPLFYDLGNAFFRTGDFGRAVLNYERALALNRHQPEAIANLEMARDEAHALELPRLWPERWFRVGDVHGYAIAAAITFWLAAFCLVLLIFRKRRTAMLTCFAALSFIFCALLIVAVSLLETGNHGRSLAIVTGNDVQARLATADNAGSVLALPPGSEIKVLSKRGDWLYAALPNDLRGWIPAASAQKVRM